MSHTITALGHRYREKVRIGRGELQVAIAGEGLMPTADTPACSSSSSSCTKKRKD